MKGNYSMIHEMTLDEYINSMRGKKVEHFYYNRKGQLIRNHMDAVIHAIQLGWNVPDGVIKSLYYPLPRNLQVSL